MADLLFPQVSNKKARYVTRRERKGKMTCQHAVLDKTALPKTEMLIFVNFAQSHSKKEKKRRKKKEKKKEEKKFKKGKKKKKKKKREKKRREELLIFQSVCCISAYYLNFWP